jgi:hypothetical protein
LIIAIPEALREKLGPEGAQALADLLNEARVQSRGDVIEIAASRFQSQLAEEIGGLRAELHREIGGLRAELHREIGGLRSEMHELIGGLRSEMQELIGGLRSEMNSKLGALEARIIRWMFVFWIGQIGALLGILFVFFRR